MKSPTLDNAAACRLVVEEGDHPGMIYPLHGDGITIGRGPENTIQIIDTRISRVHVELSQSNGFWTVRDLQSKNGTSVNRSPIAATVRLVPGDSIQIGSTTFLFEAETSAPTRDEDVATGVLLSDVDPGLETSHVLKISALEIESEGASASGVPEDADLRLQSIYRVGKLIQSILDLDELLSKLMETICQVLEPTYACILLYDSKRGILVPKSVHRPPSSESDLIISGSIIEQVMDMKAAVLMEDSREDERFAKSDSIVVQSIRSAICVPLISKSEVLGALYLDRRVLEAQFTEGDLEWAAGVAGQAALAISMAMLHNEMVERHQRERELEIARSIQMNLLPKTMPQIEGFEFAGLSEPARMVGGDYFDVVALPEGDVALTIADVSGKGVPSAILVASIRSAVRIEARSLLSDGILKVMDRLNDAVCEQTMSNMFVTMFLAYLEPETRRLTYCNAGHVHPMLRMPDGELIHLEAGGCFLGVMPGAEYEKGSVKMPPGSMVVFVSDGVADSVNSEGDIYGLERLTEFVLGHPDLSAQEFCKALEAEVDEFRQSAEPFDDFTVLVARAL